MLVNPVITQSILPVAAGYVSAVTHGDQEPVAAAAAGLRMMMAGEASGEKRQAEAPRSFTRHDIVGSNGLLPNNGVPGPDRNQRLAYRIAEPTKE